MLDQKGKRAAIEAATELCLDGGAPVADYVEGIITAYLAHAGEPVAWRWKPKDGEIWIYDPEWLEEHRHEIDAEPLYAAPQAQARVKVKPLRWDEAIHGGWAALGAAGLYHVHVGYRNETRFYFFTSPFDHEPNEFCSAEKAKAAAQADYERRILSSLSQPHPADERVVAPRPNWNGWRSIDTAPEDCRVILATVGNWVGEAIMLRDEDTGEQIWTWVDTGKPSRHSCYGWMPLPEPLSAPVPSGLRPDGFDGPTGAE